MRNSVLTTDRRTDGQSTSAGVELRFAAKNVKRNFGPKKKCQHKLLSKEEFKEKKFPKKKFIGQEAKNSYWTFLTVHLVKQYYLNFV